MVDWNNENMTVGRYTLLGKLGAGGMAEVFLARSKGAGGIDKTLVLKKIHSVLAKNARFIDMFMDEARVAMRLNHSNIVQVYAFEHVENDYVLAMEFVDGGDLLRLQTLAYEEGERIPFELCAYVAAEIAKGLDYAHSRRDDQGIPLELVHRDVSPQNVLISRDGAVKVTDFGIVKARDAHEEMGEVKGKLGYMSPQQARGLPVDKRADIYSLGVVLHEMLVGATVDKPKLGEIVELAPPVEVDPTVPSEISRITMRALAADPAERYQSCRELAHDLSSYLRTCDDIIDATTVEEWIARVIPSQKLTAAKLEQAGGCDSDVTTRVDSATVAMPGIGETERQAAVMVSVQLTLEPDTLPDAFSREFNHLVEEISYKTGGIQRYSSGAVHIFFGLPTSSFEDAIRALRLAHDLEDVLHSLCDEQKLELPWRIAVTRGHVRLSKQTENEALQFHSTPLLKNTAAQLLDVCEDNGIVCGQGVYQMARTDYHFGTPLAIAVANEQNEQELTDFYAYSVGRAKSKKERHRETETAEVRVVGRQEELARMEKLLELAGDNTASVLKITGELGLGKTSLLNAFVRTATARQFKVVYNECLFDERDLPLAAAVGTIRALLNVDDRDGDAQHCVHRALDTLFHQIPHYRGRQETFFNALLMSPQKLWDRSVHHHRDLIRRTAFSLGVLIHRCASPNGLILVIDNGQWLDGPSVDVLSELARNILDIPVMVVIAGQPETLVYRRIDNLHVLELAELPREDMFRLITEKIGSSPDIEEIATQILERSHGNPFFATEIIDSLIDRGIIEKETETADGHPVFRQTRPGIIHLPSTVKGIAESRINTLSLSQRTALRAASVFGADFAEDHLQAIVGKELIFDLVDLEQKGFLVSRRNEHNQITFSFRRSVEREAAYDGLSDSDRRQLHMKLARALMRREDKGESIPLAQIAWHLDKSGQDEMAARYYLKAGDSAMNVYSGRRALRFIDRALSLLPLGCEERYNALVRKERVVRDIGLHDMQMTTLKEMEDLGKRLDDVHMQANTAYRCSRKAYSRGDFADAAIKLKDAIGLAEQSGDRTLQVECLRALGYLAIENGRLKECYECCERALLLVTDDDSDVYLKARIMGLKGLLFMERGLLAEAAYPLITAMLLFRQQGDKRNESVQLSNLGLLAQARGFLMEAIGFFEHALGLDIEIRDVSERGRKLVGLADIRVELGQFETGEKMLKEALSICRENSEPIGEIEAELGIADFLIQTDDAQGAFALLTSLQEQGVLQDSAMSRARQRRLLTEALIARGEYDNAALIAREATEIARKSMMDAEVIHGASLLALSLAKLLDYSAVETVFSQIPQLASRIGLFRHAEKVWWRYAETAALLGDEEAGRIGFQKAQAEIRRKMQHINSQKHLAIYQASPFVKRVMDNRTRG